MTRISERLGVLITGCLSVMPYALSRGVFALVLLFLIKVQACELAVICSYVVYRMSYRSTAPSAMLRATANSGQVSYVANCIR